MGEGSGAQQHPHTVQLCLLVPHPQPKHPKKIAVRDFLGTADEMSKQIRTFLRAALISSASGF